MGWNISSHVVSLKGQDDIFIHTFGDGEHLCAVIDGHGDDRSVVDHVLRRLPVLCEELGSQLHLSEVISVLSEETDSMLSGACVSLAHLLPDGRMKVATLGDSPALWGSCDFQSITDLYGMAPHAVGSNIRERTRILLSGAKILGNYIRSPKNHDLLAVTRALGDAHFVPLLLREPEYAEARIEAGDFLLLCTDGFCDIRLPLSKTRVDWKHGISRRDTAAQLINAHTMKYGIYDDTTVIVAYRY